jgi:hypothetical protein
MELPAIRTWVDFQHGGVISLEDDVLGVVRRVKAIDSRLHVFYNEQSGEFDIVEHCLDGVQRLVFSVGELDGRVVDRLLLADHWKNASPNHVIGDDEDILARVDKENDELEAAWTEERMDKIRDAGERIAWALDLPLKGNVGKGESILIKRSPFAEDDPSGDQGGT